MTAERLSSNGTIGIFCSSHIADAAQYENIVKALNRLGFRVKLGANIYKDTYGFVASTQERAEDLNMLINDDEVEMIFFGGGKSAVEILPFIDYEGIKKHPKIFSSYSDGTSILNAVYAQTGLVTYYGATPAEFPELSYYNYKQFFSNFVKGHRADHFEKDGNWITAQKGRCNGLLIGGYAPFFGLMLANRRFSYNPDEKYILLLEDNEKFSNVGAVSTYLGFIEQSLFMNNVVGMVFGQYAKALPDDLLHCLERFGARNNIPVLYTDDFGHGVRHGILPIGTRAELDTETQTISYI